jgi:membrane protein
MELCLTVKRFAMTNKRKPWLTIFRQTFDEFGNDKVMKLSAALAYYTIFSLPPMLIVLIASAGFIYGREAIEGRLYSHITEWVGSNAALQIEQMIKSIHLSGKGKLATIVGLATLIIGATGVFIEIQDSINLIWGIRPRPKKGWLSMLINRLLSFSMVLSMGFLLLVSLLINALLSSFEAKISVYLPDLSVYILFVGNYLLTFGIIALLFGTIYKVLPDARIGWRDVTVGAIATAILFMIGKFAIGLYLQHSNLGSAYGAAGSIVIILVWVYYSSIILYFGAEFTQVYAHHCGTKITPKEYAVLYKEQETYGNRGLTDR